MITNNTSSVGYSLAALKSNVVNKSSGFTLIELVVVIVMIGFLAVNAIPKFIDLTGQAKQANIEGMAGGFATGVSLVRSQWESESRPTDTSGTNFVSYDGTTVYLTNEDKNTSPGIRPGYIVGTSSSASINSGSMSVNDCVSVWNSLLQQPPLITTAVSNLNADSSFRYLASVSGSGASTLCYYHLKDTLARDSNDNYLAPSGLSSVGNSFSYQPATSAVVIHINNS